MSAASKSALITDGDGGNALRLDEQGRLLCLCYKCAAEFSPLPPHPNLPALALLGDRALYVLNEATGLWDRLRHDSDTADKLRKLLGNA